MPPEVLDQVRLLLASPNSAHLITVPATWRERRQAGLRYLHALIELGVEDLYEAWRPMLKRLGYDKDPAMYRWKKRPNWRRLTRQEDRSQTAWGVFKWAAIPLSPKSPTL
jgi:hypothetical protein